MTEYDYSPEAYERYLATQNRIARWVDTTLQQPPRNPFTPATPAVQARKELRLDDDDDDDSYRSSRRHRDRDRGLSNKHSSRSSPSSPSRHRPRSASHSARPTPTRSQSTPYYDDRVRPPNSRHSSNTSSSTLRPRSGTTSHFPQHPQQQQQPNSAPPYPKRSYTTPATYGGSYPSDSKHIPYPQAYPPNQTMMVPNGAGGYTMVPQPQNLNTSNLPQLPYAAYATPSPTKQVSLLKRLFTGLSIGSKRSSSTHGSPTKSSQHHHHHHHHSRKRRDSY